VLVEDDQSRHHGSYQAAKCVEEDDAFDVGNAVVVVVANACLDWRIVGAECHQGPFDF